MNLSGRQPWLGAMLLASLSYPGAGVLFGALAASASSERGRTAWRLAAFLVSGVVFLAHLRHEYVNGPASPPRVIAARVAMGVAIGMLVLAVVGPLRTHGVSSGRAVAALLLWPAITAVPAFGLAWALLAGFARWGGRGSHRASGLPN